MAAAAALAALAPAAALAAPSARNPQSGGRPPRSTATCRPTVPAGQRTLYGLVTQKGVDRAGMFQNFKLVANGVTYTVVTNFYDGSAPLTRVVNLACRQSPVQFVQVAGFVYVTGTVGSAAAPRSRVVRASVVQVPTLKDRGA